MTDLSRLRLGTAPDSWGVWFPDDPNQVPWDRFLDEAAEAGYSWIELGPYGYLPTDPERLRDELGRRGLRLSGGAVFAGLHRGADALARAVEDCRQEARLLTALGARHLVLLPEIYSELDGSLNQPVDLSPDQWRDLTTGMSTLARTLHDESDVELVFHPHADSHVGTQPQVERFLADTDPDHVQLCLDTGHISYYDGDNIAIIRTFPERIGYVHLKQVDPAVVQRVREQQLGFAPAVRLGVMVEPPNGVPEMQPLLDVLGGLDVDLFAIVEQDLYPCDKDVPLPIATRTAQYLGSCGLRPVSRRA
ncbi:TIM barrel protein [Pseudonocardia acidicola]|uniref:TIM barrel protein n=1 Tax=Pseudonocardia acidicola TaxID=2724939 RepID=A0ABX1S5V7_9PSEU|nr:TIM barrel protein [Pseudonocardia acidicola]NMH96950.1 TIM barrel protein [Pseudonocardia acidicola]